VILRMTPKEMELHAQTRHGPTHKEGPGNGFCAWGFSNVKHGDDSGNKGQAARRKYLARGKKYWKMAKEKA
jgi:hypothetical protein